MGIICTCGALTPLPLTAVNVTFDFSNDGSSTGSATYVADVCANRANLGSISLNFIDTDNADPNRSFTFLSTNITEVSCQAIGDDCFVLVSGSGLVTGEANPRIFVASFLHRPDNLDLISDFIITGFAQQNFVATVPQEIVTFGC